MPHGKYQRLVLSQKKKTPNAYLNQRGTLQIDNFSAQFATTTEENQWQDLKAPFTRHFQNSVPWADGHVSNNLRSQTTVICSMHARAVGGGSE